MWQHMYDAPAPTLRDPAPSPEDLSVTREIVNAGKLLSIDVLDHLVIGHNRYTSLKEKGIGFD